MFANFTLSPIYDHTTGNLWHESNTKPYQSKNKRNDFTHFYPNNYDKLLYFGGVNANKKDLIPNGYGFAYWNTVGMRF